MNQREISRREFLKISGTALATVGILTAVGCGSSKKEGEIAEPLSTQENIPTTSAEAPEEGWKIYHGEAYEIEFPKDWSSVDTSSAPGEIETFIADGHFTNDEHDDKNVYVNFRIEKLFPDETTIEDYKARVIRGILYERGDEITGREKGIQEFEGQELLGQPSVEVSYTVHHSYDVQPGAIHYDYDRKNLLRMQVRGRNVIVLKYSASGDNFDKYRPTFEHMVASLILK